MLDRKWVLENLELALGSRPGGAGDPAVLASLGKRRVELIQQADELRNERKTTSAEIGKMKKAGEDTAEVQGHVRSLGEKIAEIESTLADIEENLNNQLLSIPNIPLEDVPEGADEADNIVVREYGAIPAPQDWYQPHWDTGENLGILDLERAAKVAGSRFVFMRGKGARLELELANWMVSVHATDGYEEILPPYLVRSPALLGTGQLPKFEEDLFKTTDDRYLIPTAEVPVTNLLADEILSAADLPKKFVAFSPCFRAEAGSAGKDTRGIVRVHQFHKVELVQFEFPENSIEVLESLTLQAEKILQLLDLPYRVINLCTGDLGFSSAKTYDLEVWLPGQERWLEISSCSTFGDFQARRANIRYRPEADMKPEFVHTLNGSALAVGRTVVAILENYQNQDGSITIPEVLRDRMGVEKIGRITG